MPDAKLIYFCPILPLAFLQNAIPCLRSAQPRGNLDLQCFYKKIAGFFYKNNIVERRMFLRSGWIVKNLFQSNCSENSLPAAGEELFDIA